MRTRSGNSSRNTSRQEELYVMLQSFVKLLDVTLVYAMQFYAMLNFVVAVVRIDSVQVPLSLATAQTSWIFIKKKLKLNVRTSRREFQRCRQPRVCVCKKKLNLKQVRCEKESNNVITTDNNNNEDQHEQHDADQRLLRLFGGTTTTTTDDDDHDTAAAV